MLKAAHLLLTSCLEPFSCKGICCPFAHTLIQCNWDKRQLQSLRLPSHSCAVNWWILIKIPQGILQSLKVTFVLLHLVLSLNKYFKLDDSTRRFYSNTSSTHFPALLNHKALDSFPRIRSKISSGYIDHSTNHIMKTATRAALKACLPWILHGYSSNQYRSDSNPSWSISRASFRCFSYWYKHFTNNFCEASTGSITTTSLFIINFFPYRLWFMGHNSRLLGNSLPSFSINACHQSQFSILSLKSLAWLVVQISHPLKCLFIQKW